MLASFDCRETFHGVQRDPSRYRQERDGSSDRSGGPRDCREEVLSGDTERFDARFRCGLCKHSRLEPGVLHSVPGSARRLSRAVRSYQRCKKRGFPFKSLSKYWLLEHRFWSIVAGADIPLKSDIGGGLQLTHPNGVVIFPGAVIGPNCLISQQVTIGVGGPKPDAPVIGGHVDIGAGAKILGGVKIGDHARIGANAVALQDVPSGATAGAYPQELCVAEVPSRITTGPRKKKARRTVPRLS